MMLPFLRTLTAQLVLVGMASAVSVSAQSQSTEAEPVSPFVGHWIINKEKSTYDPNDTPKETSVRTLDLHANGVFLETHRNTRIRNGEKWEGFYHWVGTIDGKEFPEFGRTGGPEPGNRLTIIPASSHKWNVTFRNRDGKVVITDTWTVSPDGKTLTIDRRQTPPNRPPTHSVEVYDNEGFAMPGSR